MRALRLIALATCLAAVGVGVALLFGRDAVGVLVALSGAMVALMLRSRTAQPDTDGSGVEPHRPGDLIQAQFDVQLPAGRTLDEVAGRLVRELGLRRDGDNDNAPVISLEGGSQLRVRLLGGWHVNVRHLPARVELRQTSAAQIHVSVRDALGVIVRDAKLRARYGELANEIRATAQRC